MTNVPRAEAGAARPEPAEATASQTVSSTTMGLSTAIDAPVEFRSTSQLSTTLEGFGAGSSASTRLGRAGGDTP